MSIKHINGTTIELPDYMAVFILGEPLSDIKRQAGCNAIRSFRDKYGLKTHIDTSKRNGRFHASPECSSLEDDAPPEYIAQYLKAY